MPKQSDDVTNLVVSIRLEWRSHQVLSFRANRKCSSTEFIASNGCYLVDSAEKIEAKISAVLEGWRENEEIVNIISVSVIVNGSCVLWQYAFDSILLTFIWVRAEVLQKYSHNIPNSKSAMSLSICKFHSTKCSVRKKCARHHSHLSIVLFLFFLLRCGFCISLLLSSSCYKCTQQKAFAVEVLK